MYGWAAGVAAGWRTGSTPSTSAARGDCFRRENPAAGASALAGAPSKAMVFCAFCWSRRGKPPADSIPDCDAYRRLTFRQGRASAQVAVARQLAIRLYIRLRDQIDYEEFCRCSSQAGMLGEVALA